MSEKYRNGGNYLNVNDENKPPYTSFYVMVTGHIQSGQLNEFDGICVKYDFVHGTDWQILGGNRSGVS